MVAWLTVVFLIALVIQLLHTPIQHNFLTAMHASATILLLYNGKIAINL